MKKCPRCAQLHDSKRELCPYCTVVTSTLHRESQSFHVAVEDQARDAWREYRQERIDMSSGGWIDN